MISLAAVGSAGDAASYYAQDNYYTGEQNEGASAWLGQGAAELELSGPVEAVAFAAVLKGELPDGSIINAKRNEHRPGWDLTMSASKSVSVLALVGGDHRLVDAFRQASQATLAWVERNLAEGRVTKNGQQAPERTGNLVAAAFLHDANRADEPQLHVHNVLANATRTSDGRWHALRSDELYNRQHVIDAVLNAYFRARVEGLGYETLPARNPINGSFEIRGVPREAVEAFSRRSAEIQAYLDARGLQGTPRERELAALATRDPKAPVLSPEQRGAGWRELAAEHGIDAGKLVEVALARAGRAETVWSQVVKGVRGVGERGLLVAARMGMTPRDGDPLVPERLGRLEPRAYAAAQAVASAARELGEREAAFDRLDLIRTALSRGGPVMVGDVEARLALLESKGLLIGDSGRMVTTEGAVRLERAHLAGVEEGRGRSVPLMPEAEARMQAQEAARELGLSRLNPGQEAAAALILSSSDRVVNVQGGPGRGKSAALAPVTAIAKGEGRSVIGLAVAGRTARSLGRDTGAEASTLAGFLGKHARVIDGTARHDQVARATAALRGTVLLLDEASQVGTYDMERLVRLANMTGVARLVMVGDTRQLGAVNAGKPFERSQATGHATAHLTQNLRSASEQMKAVTAALDRGEVAEAFEVLKPATVEVAMGEQATTAARMWAALPREERDGTLLLASGLKMRAAANAAAQGELKKSGEITGRGVKVDVLDRVTITREGARHMGAYAEGRVVEFRTNLTRQGFSRDERGVVVDAESDAVRLRMRSGEERVFRPGKLPRNLAQDAVSVFQVKSVELHAGDRIRWTDNDRDRGLLNADLARVEEVGRGKLTVSSLADGTVHQLKSGDRIAERLDLAYAVNVHVAQGVTAKSGIIVMSSRERTLNSAKSFMVAVTRIADKATLVVDDGRKLELGVSRNPGEKTSALEMLNGRVGPSARGAGDARPIILPSADPIEAQAVASYAQALAAVNGAREQRERAGFRDLDKMFDSERALDRMRDHGAEDVRVVTDRDPTLLRDADQGRPDRLHRAWAEEGRLRATGAPEYADRFVADWRAASRERAAATGGVAEWRAEEKLERLGERMGREPVLERALDARIPERQRGIEDQAKDRVRDRDMDMDR